MRRTVLLVFLLLVSAAWLQAQSYPSSGAGAGQSSDTSSGQKTTVEGCLQSSGGTYTITDQSGKSYQLTGDTSKLADHVGHEVQVSGKVSSATASSSASSASGTTSAGSQQETLEVSKFKHVATSCKSANK